MERDWRPIDGAPKDGRAIEGKSLDWGKGPETTVYRARWFEGVWFNAENPCEQLDHLFEWREPEPRCGIARLFDALPIDKLAGRQPRGPMLEMFGQIDFLLTNGHETLAKEAIETLAGGIAAA
jgi:hypothetical protein